MNKRKYVYNKLIEEMKEDIKPSLIDYIIVSFNSVCLITSIYLITIIK